MKGIKNQRLIYILCTMKYSRNYRILGALLLLLKRHILNSWLNMTIIICSDSFPCRIWSKERCFVKYEERNKSIFTHFENLESIPGILSCLSNSMKIIKETYRIIFNLSRFYLWFSLYSISNLIQSKAIIIHWKWRIN